MNSTMRTIDLTLDWRTLPAGFRRASFLLAFAFCVAAARVCFAANDSEAVFVPYDPDKPLPKFGGVFSDGFNFLTADGGTHFCPKGFDEKKMRAAITRAGGEKVDIDDLQP